MSPTEIVRLVRAQPFAPFRMHLVGGKSYLVRHPEFVLVERTRLFLGLPGPEGIHGPVAESFVIALDHILRCTPVGRKSRAKSRNGRGRRAA